MIFGVFTELCSYHPRHGVFIFYVSGHVACGALRSLTRDWTCAPCIGSMESNTGSPGKSLVLSTDGTLTLQLLQGCSVQFSSVTQSCPALCGPMNRSTPGLPAPGVHSDSRPSSQWCLAASSSSVVPFSSCPQSRPASGSFLMSQLFAWGGQSSKQNPSKVGCAFTLGPHRGHWWGPLPLPSHFLGSDSAFSQSSH